MHVTTLVSKLYSDCTLGRLGALGGLAVGPLGRPAVSPGFTPLGMSSLDTPDPGRSKASSPTFMKPRGLFLTALSAAPFTSGLPAFAPGNCNKDASCCFCRSCVNVCSMHQQHITDNPRKTPFIDAKVKCQAEFGKLACWQKPPHRWQTYCV